MVILLVGSFKHGSLESSYMRAFRGLNLNVLQFDIDAWFSELRWWLRSRIGHRATINNLTARKLGSKRYNERLLEVANSVRPDIVLAFNGFFILPETAYNIRSLGSKFILFHADNPLPGNYNFRPEVLPLARACDHFFIWSRRLANNLSQMGIQASFLPFGWDSKYTPYQGADPQLLYDVTFVGGWDPEREAFLEIIANYFNLKIWGPSYWGKRTKPGGKVRKCWRGAQLEGEAMAQVVARSSISLNILRRQHYLNHQPIGTIMRTFEAPGAGAFLVSTRSDDATSIFSEGSSGAYFTDVQECIETIDYYLTNPLMRKDIVRSSHDLVDRHHQYSDRAMDILRFCEVSV